MKLAIDIDGVITDIEFIAFIKILKHTILDTKPINTYKNKPLMRKLMFEFIKFYSKKGKIRENVSEIINKMKQEGCEIYIISKRAFADEDTKEGEIIRALVELMFIENNIPYDHMIFTNDKKKVCLDNDIPIIIEDNPLVITELAQVMKVICFRTLYNQEITKTNNIEIANDWPEAYTHWSNHYHKPKTLKFEMKRCEQNEEEEDSTTSPVTSTVY